MLQLVADEIAESSTVIFNKVIQESESPMEWKKRGMGTSLQERGPPKRSQIQTSNFPSRSGQYLTTQCQRIESGTVVKQL